ncbi:MULTISPECIES: hypothetical protein [Glaesserella]|uniref:Uncharacterized protein n=1 Tax=Glaesserella australis TaxID=2094024 RepID=A0A328C2I1_9PAST|nr:MULTISPECIES: hypothetical protein [Glaesserella]AUI66238.1 hypothetical protein CJD39_06420 [Glaesserella sp. 15-184]RAL19260.1 hypothetical protein C5N92_03845 [Glaesserella australis]
MSDRILDKLKQHFIKHRFCYIALGLFLLIFHQMIIASIITPYRCDMWKGKEVEVFLTPEEWRKLSGVNESLKGTEWVYYPTIEGELEKDPFFIKNQGLYQPVMYFNGNRHTLSSINDKHPNLNIYVYIFPRTILGHDTFILYDYKLQKIILQYNLIGGYVRNPLSGLPESFDCNNNAMSDGLKLIESYLNN